MAQLTKLWEAQDSLVAALKARPNLAGVAVDLGTPVHFEQDHVWVSGEVEDWQLVDGVSGLGPQDESFTLRVHLFVQRAGADYTEVRDRAAALGTELKAAIESDPYFSAGGETINFARTAGGQMEEATYDGKREAMLTVSIRCSAWVV